MLDIYYLSLSVLQHCFIQENQLICSLFFSGHPLLHIYLSPSLQPSWTLSLKDIFVRHGMSVAMRVSFSRSRPSQSHMVKPSSGPMLSPATSLEHQAHPPVPSSAPLPRRHGGHHNRHVKPLVTAPSPSEEQSCDQICTEPLTAAPFGSPCGCVFPMKVRLLLDVAPYAVFPVTRELVSEVAAGTYLEQSQVKIMGASADSQNQGKTVVDINLVPLGEKFDNTTAMLTYDRFWKNKMPLNITLFGNYEVIYISYPGLPSSPPYPNYTGSGPSGSGGDLPITANFVSKTQRMNLRTIATIALSAFVVLLVCTGAIAVVVKWRKSGRPSSAVGPTFTSSINKRSGIGSFLSSSFASSASMSLMSNMATCMLSVKTFSFAELEKATDKYVAPEYAMTGHLLVKSDVYSYGVVLLELLSGRKPVDMSQPPGQENLVTWARPLLTTREGLEQLVDPSLAGSYDFDDMAKVAAIAAMCVHSEVTNRPFMGEVVQALKLMYNDTDETCGDYCSQRESSVLESDFKADLVPSDSSWWNGGGTSPRLTYGQASSLITMDYSSGPLEEMESRPFSASSLVRDRMSLPISHGNRSGPLRTVRSKPAFYRLRGSMSEHGGLLTRRFWNDGYWV
ncbi:hypothetical protein OIU76_008493 [Salix suchowensis]|nr:hypothetical protein OIU76_008493 [Salix suchowensis]